MQVVLDEKEVKKAVEEYLMKLHNLTIQLDDIQFNNKQDKTININGVVVVLKEKEVKTI